MHELDAFVIKLVILSVFFGQLPDHLFHFTIHLFDFSLVVLLLGLGIQVFADGARVVQRLVVLQVGRVQAGSRFPLNDGEKLARVRHHLARLIQPFKLAGHFIDVLLVD